MIGKKRRRRRRKQVRSDLRKQIRASGRFGFRDDQVESDDGQIRSCGKGPDENLGKDSRRVTGRIPRKPSVALPGDQFDGGSSKASAKQRLVYPRVGVVIGMFMAGAAILFLVSVPAKDPGMIELGVQDLISVFSVTDKQNGANGDDEDGGLAGNVSWQGRYSNDLPEGFSEEIGLSGDSSLMVSREGRTVGFTRKTSVRETMESVKEELARKGWSYVPSSQEFAATFVKDEGTYHWLAITCVSVGEETSVVVVLGQSDSSTEIEE